MLIKQYREQFVQKLSSLYDVMEAESFFYLILENRHQMKRIDLIINPELAFSIEEIKKWDAILEQLLLEIPIQYVLGTAHFYGLEFEVNENVLIPRPETEELVDWIINDCRLNKQSNIKVLDIGTGSGCIAISLAKNLDEAQVSAIDISDKALETACKNALDNGVVVDFYEKNILETTALEQQFDIIVSNPPYVRQLEKSEIKKNVLDNEPHLALFVADHDALVFYRKIAGLAQQNLVGNGWLYFEINQYLGKEMIALLEEMNFRKVVLRKDIYGNDRMIKAEK